MTDQQLQILEVISEQSGMDKNAITSTTEIAALCNDCHDEIELLIALEDQFAIELADEDFEACKTVQDVFNLIAGTRRL